MAPLFKIVRDRNVALELYRRGDIDVLWRLPAGGMASPQALFPDAGMITSLALSPAYRAGGQVFFGTFGRGVWRLDDPPR